MIPGIDNRIFFEHVVTPSNRAKREKQESHFDIVALFIKTQVLGAFLNSWKIFAKEVRKQGREASEEHRARQEERRFETLRIQEASYRFQQYLSSPSKEFCPYKGEHLEHFHLTRPV